MDFVKAFLKIPLTEETFLKWHEKMRFFNGLETLDPQVSSILKATVRPFGGLTMIFFKVHETLV
jgi:hypothetical protein